MDAIQSMENRRSVRSYQEKTVEPDKVSVIVNAGSHAPCAAALQLSVITNQGILQEINGQALEAMKQSENAFLKERAAISGYQPLYGAPVLILLSSPDETYAEATAACAATCMTIAATALGLGSCYVVTPTLILDGKNELSKQVGVKEENKPICGVLIGYAAECAIPNTQRDNIDVNYIE